MPMELTISEQYVVELERCPPSKLRKLCEEFEEKYSCCLYHDENTAVILDDIGFQETIHTMRRVEGKEEEAEDAYYWAKEGIKDRSLSEEEIKKRDNFVELAKSKGYKVKREEWRVKQDWR